MNAEKSKQIKAVLPQKSECDKFIVAVWTNEESAMLGSGTSFLGGYAPPEVVGFVSEKHWPHNKNASKLGLIECNSNLEKATMVPKLIDIEEIHLLRVGATYESATSTSEPHYFGERK